MKSFFNSIGRGDGDSSRGLHYIFSEVSITCLLRSPLQVIRSLFWKNWLLSDGPFFQLFIATRHTGRTVPSRHMATWLTVPFAVHRAPCERTSCTPELHNMCTTSELPASPELPEASRTGFAPQLPALSPELPQMPWCHGVILVCWCH